MSVLKLLHHDEEVTLRLCQINISLRGVLEKSFNSLKFLNFNWVISLITCDICGNIITGEPIIVEVEGAVLALCSACASKYVSTKNVKVLSKPTTTKQRPTVREHYAQKNVTIRYQPLRKRASIDRLEIVEDYADLVKTAREGLGLSRDALAKIIGVKESVVRRIEEGQLIPDLELARKLEKVLNITLIREKIEEPSITSTSSKHELTLGDIVEIRRRDRKSKS